MTLEPQFVARHGRGRGFRVLVVDDERPLAEVVARNLAHDGYEVATAFSGPDAVERARELDPDIVILDLGLPGMDGLEVCRQVRESSDCYIIMLTARAEELDTVAGLRAGADDYVTKPFSPRELVERVRALLRRPRQVAKDPRPQEPPRVFGPLSIDLEARDVQLDGVPIALTRTEFDLLGALTARAGEAMTRRLIIDTVWGESWIGDEQLVDVHIGNLRRKLDDPASRPRFIRTVRGVGYRLDPEPAAPPAGDGPA